MLPSPEMCRFSPIINLLLSKHQIFSSSSQFQSRNNLIRRSFHISRALDDHFRRSNGGLGLVCLEKDHHKEPTSTSKHDEFAGDVEKAYRILRKFHSRIPKLELALNESGIELRSGLIERVMNRCGDGGNLGYRFFVWAAKKRPVYSHSYEVYKSMVKILSKMRRFEDVWDLIGEMRKENPQLIEPELFLVLLRRFSSAEMVKNACKVFDEMPRNGLEPDEFVFGCLFDAVCKNGNVKDAAKLFEDMRLRFKPNLRYFTSLLCGWCREGKMIEAEHVLVLMKEAGFEPDVVDYMNLLNGYVHAGKFADAYDLLKYMRRRKGFEPNANCYAVLIQGLCKVDRMDEAMSVFVEMERYGCEADTMTYTALVSGFCKCGKVDKCYGLIDDMIKKGLMPSQLTYVHIIAVHEKEEKFKKCLELMEKMKRIGYHLDLEIYNVVIRLACKLGEVKEAFRLWDEMEVNGLSPEVDTFVITINGLISHGCLLESCDRFKEMVTRGLFSVPQHGTLKSLLNTLLRDGKLEMAADVWRWIITSNGTCEVNVPCWTIWIHALFSRGYVKEACSYCIEMIEMDLMPQPDTFAKLMKGLKKLYNREFAVEITDKVRNMAAAREVSFKMYKRRGVEKPKAKKDRDEKKKKKQRTP